MQAMKYHGLTVEFTFDHTPAEKGDRGSYGELLSPDIPEDFSITGIYIGGEDADEFFADLDLFDDFAEAAQAYMEGQRNEP